MLESIEYLFPNHAINAQLFDLLCTLFQDIPYASIHLKQEISLIASPLKPKTVFKIDNNIADLQFNIGNSKYFNLLNRKKVNIKNKESPKIQKLSMVEVKNKLKGHVKRIDHTGVNLPSSLYSKNDWNDLLNYLSSVSNLYHYPTGELWPFLLPSTPDENLNEINNFTIIREPRFELVYDYYTDVVAIQVDFETDLSKPEVEALFPKNQGIYFHSLEDTFKTIYLDYSEYLDIRFDIRFNCPHNSFESGEWFVSEGKRMK